MSAVEELYAAAYYRLVSILDVVCDSRPEAEEVVQEAFIRLIARADKIMAYDDPEAWVRAVAFRIASNRRRNAAASARKWLRLSQLAADGRSTAPDSTGTDVALALRQIPQSHREVLVLHYLLNHSIPEIAEILRVPSGTVKSRLHRARDQFARYYSSEDDHVGSS